MEIISLVITNHPAIATNIVPSSVTTDVFIDFFIRQYIKKSIKTSVVTLLGTILVAIAGWFIITRDIISNYILNNLWIIPLLTLFNILLGTFKGLRIKDFFRFRFTTRENEK